MNIVVLGINHKTAPVEVREKLAFTDNQLEEAYSLLKADKEIKECVLLSTCNRTELYANCDDFEKGKEALIKFLCDLKNVSPQAIRPSVYFYKAAKAVSHLFLVGSGLDSMVIGETQILGQVRTSYEKADSNNSVSKVFHHLFRQAIVAGKRVQSETGINNNAVSISYAAVELAKRIFDNLESRSVLVMGAGKMSHITLKHLCNQGVKDIYVVNRTKQRAIELAEKFNGQHVEYKDMYESMQNVDIVISSTGAPHYMIKKDDMTKLMKRRKNRPIFLIDIAVPRDIEPSIDDLSSVYLYDIDNLQGVVDENMSERVKAAEKAKLIIEEETVEFEIWYKTLDVVPLITALRQKAESIRQTELKRSLDAKLGKLDDKEKKAVDNLTRAIMNRILREPVLRIKDIAVKDKSESYVASLCHLFDLDVEGEEIDEQEQNSANNKHEAGVAK